MSNLVWISWEKHRRTEEICDYLSIAPIVIVTEKKSFARYIYLVKETIIKINRFKPSTLIVQNPSIVLTLLAVMLKPLFKYQLIVDAHNEAIQPFTHNYWIIRVISNFLIKFSNYTIVTNMYLAKIVECNEGQAVILPDRLPKIGKLENIDINKYTFNIILIATYAADEPIKEIIEAACELENEITLYVTGNNSKLDKEFKKQLPDNIVFTGFLSNKSYWSYLKSANAIIDLSLKDNCLVCGAYEGIAVEKPLILSGSQATKDYFSKGVVYTDNSKEDIKKCYISMIKNYNHLCQEILELKNVIQNEWIEKANRLKEVLR